MPVRPRVRIRAEHSQHVQDAVQIELPGRTAVVPCPHHYFAAVCRAAFYSESHFHAVLNGRTRGR